VRGVSLDPVHDETLHDGPRFTVRRGVFRDDDGGGERTREWVEAPDAVAVVAYDDAHVHLVRQAREAIGRADVLELPAGLMDEPGEAPVDTARRELREEIGLDAADWVHATSYFSSSGFTDEEVHVFLATGLTRVGPVEEGIEHVTWPLADLDGLIDGNVDAKTLVGLLWLQRARAAGGAAAG
jgi:8-oxo-dGTP pyrophosphatase MutT (NUDIX family)